MKEALKPMDRDKSARPCECLRDVTPNDKCWKCWYAEINRLVGVMHSVWLMGKVRESISIEQDIEHFVKSQEEKGVK